MKMHAAVAVIAILASCTNAPTESNTTANGSVAVGQGSTTGPISTSAVIGNPSTVGATTTQTTTVQLALDPAVYKDIFGSLGAVTPTAEQVDEAIDAVTDLPSDKRGDSLSTLAKCSADVASCKIQLK